MTGLDEILSGTPAQEPPPPARPPEPMVPRREPEPERPTPEPERSPEPGENPSVPPAEEQEPDHVPITALRDERRKRQEFERVNREYEQRIAQYEQMMQRYQQPQPEPPPQRPDLFTDPDGALEHIQRQFQAELERRDQEANKRFLDRSVASVMRQYPDYREAERDFIAAVQANPTLYDAMMREPEPAEYAYRIGKQVQALREFGANPEAYRERVRQEEREAARKEFEEQLQQQQPSSQAPRRSSIPPSLANARDTSGRFQPQWAGPTPLKDILSSR